jgi:hypothetical protein
MPSPFLRSTGGPSSEFYRSVGKRRLKSKIPGRIPSLNEWEKSVARRKTALMKEWDERLASVHPQQWEYEQRKRARRSARGSGGR